jgi:hypothetical protein
VLEKVEVWIRESITEIVSHIASFLVHMFNSDDDEDDRVTVRSSRSPRRRRAGQTCGASGPL